MRLPVSLAWKAGLLLLALAIQFFTPQASSSVNAQAIPDVGVTGIELPAGPVNQGDTADIKVTIENLGSATASVLVILRYLDTDYTAAGVGQMMRDVEAGQTAKASFSWDTTDVPLGSYTFQAVALSGKNLDGEDGNHENNSLISTSSITIRTPPPYAVAFTAVDVSAGPVTQGDTVNVDVTVENQGTSDANAEITLLYVSDKGQPGIAAEKTVAIAAGDAETVTLSWDTFGVTPGVYTIRAGATLVEDSNAADSMDAASTITISAPPAYAVAVTAVDVPAGPVTQGNTVDVDVTVENQGTSDATAEITLLYTPDQGQPGIATAETVAIAAAAAETVTLSWDTSGVIPGVYTIRASATLVEDNNAADSMDAASTIAISAPPAYAVAVTAVVVPAGPVTQGNTVNVDVTVENQGTSDANAEITLLYVPAAGEPGIAAEKTVAIPAGESETFTLFWDTSEATLGTHTIRAGATLVEDSNAADSMDAASTITISPPTYGVSITAFDVPSGPATQGYVVDADVTIKNLGSVAAMFTVTLFDQPAGGPEGTADEETVEIATAATKKVTLSWDTSDAAPGPHTFRAGVALVEDANVSDSRDSAAIITISPPPYAVAIAAVQVASATVIQGATVNADVTVENQGTSDANATVTLVYTPAEGEQGIAAEKTVPIAAGESVTITLSWDTSNAAPGVYTVRAGATLVEDTDVAHFLVSTTSITISAPPPYAVSVTAVDVASATAIQGDTVNVDVTVENQGTSDANAEITLLYIPVHPRPGPTGNRRRENRCHRRRSRRNGHPVLGYLRRHARRLHHQGRRNPG